MGWQEMAPFTMPVSHTRVPIQVPAVLVMIQSLANAPKKSEASGRRTQAPATHVRNQEFLSPGFSLAQHQLLPGFGYEPVDLKSLPSSLCLSNKLKKKRIWEVVGGSSSED